MWPKISKGYCLMPNLCFFHNMDMLQWWKKPKVFNKILENFIIDIAVLQLLYKCRGDSTLIDRAFNTISWPQVAICINNGLMLFPSSVKEYSTRGGISLNCSRWINPSTSSSFSCSLNTFRDIDGIRTAISPKRLVWSDRLNRINGFHLPPIKVIVAVTGQGLFSTLFSTLFSISYINVTTIFHCYQKVTVTFWNYH